jgi:hypothetical protein
MAMSTVRPESAGEFVDDRRDAVVIPAQHHDQMLWAILAIAYTEREGTQGLRPAI